MDERRLTIIVVPHGDLETRTFQISYRRLKIGLIVVGALLLLNAAIVALWFPVAAQAGRVGALENQLEQLETERARVAELARTLADVEAQYERVRELLGADAPTRGNPPLLPPLRSDSAAETSEPVSSRLDAWPLNVAGFVTRRLSTGRMAHPGLDIAVPTNSYIRAAGDGLVSFAGVDEVYGRYILIDHGAGLESLYGHASRLLVKTGDVVERYEVIGLTGSTGQSTAPHLHFEVRRGGDAVDPLTFVRQP